MINKVYKTLFGFICVLHNRTGEITYGCGQAIGRVRIGRVQSLAEAGYLGSRWRDYCSRKNRDSRGRGTVGPASVTCP